MEVSIAQASYHVREEEGEVDICVELTGQLNRPIVLELVPSSDTADTSDFNSSSLFYTFDSMSENMTCMAVEITQDSIVEVTERFELDLQANPKDDAVLIRQNSAEILIDDSSVDCKHFPTSMV